MSITFEMKLLLLGALACLAGAGLLLLWRGGAEKSVPLDVAFKLTDEAYQPLAGVPVRLVFGTPDWQAADAGIRIVTDQDGTARFTVQAVVDRRWSSSNIGFTPFSMPFRADHIAVAAELTFVMPKRDGGETVHRFLYKADINRMPDGDCNTEDLDEVYEAGPDGRFTTLIGRNAAGPNFSGLIDGWKLGGAGYRLSDFMLSRGAEATHGQDTAWHLKLAIVRKPKPTFVD
jgi:hypothetical protein